jgi:predicted metalloenzyme YecM
MINIDRLQELLLPYAEEVKLFFYSYGIADLVIDAKIDHVAVKALNRQKYEEYLRTYLPLSKRLSYEPVGPRDIAIAELYDPLDAGTLGKVSLIEIMEPKPGKIATTNDLIDHIELLVTNLEDIAKVLKEKNVDFKMQSNDNHTAIVIPITEWGQEVKFTDRTLLDIANQQIASGAAKVID